MSRVQSSALLGVALAIALFVPLLPARGVAQEATPAADCPATTPEENKALVERWFAAGAYPSSGTWRWTRSWRT